MELAEFFVKNAPTFLFVLIRSGGILFAAPIFGAFNIPMRIKLGLTFFLRFFWHREIQVYF